MFNVGDEAVLTDNQGNKHLGKISIVCPNGTIFGIVDSIGMGWTTNDPNNITITKSIATVAPVASQTSSCPLEVGAYVNIKHPVYAGCSLQGYLTRVIPNHNFYQATSKFGSVLATNNPLDITVLRPATQKKFNIGDLVTAFGVEGKIMGIYFNADSEEWDYAVKINNTFDIKQIGERWLNKLDHLHTWKEYIGFTDRYEYCQICDLKKK